MIKTTLACFYTSSGSAVMSFEYKVSIFGDESESEIDEINRFSRPEIKRQR